MLSEEIQKILSFPILGLKLGTETEDCSFEEITYVYNLFHEKLPITLKIGGAEARNDMRFALNLGIHKILAPMIETPYALENFVSTLCILEEEHHSIVKKSINIETATAVSNIDAMIETGCLQKLDSFTIGRSDLCASIKATKITDFRVNALVTTTVNKLKRLNKPISIGGALDKNSIDFLKTLEHPNLWVNTRNVVMKFDYATPYEELEKMVNAALEFEIILYTTLKKEFPKRDFIYDNRIQTIKKRL